MIITINSLTISSTISSILRGDRFSENDEVIDVESEVMKVVEMKYWKKMISIIEPIVIVRVVWIIIECQRISYHGSR